MIIGGKDLKSPAIITEKGIISYGEFIDSILSLSNSLKELGIKEGEKIAILSENSPEYVMLIIAIIASGAICVPINIRWPEKRIKEALEKIGCNLVISSRSIDLNVGKKVFFDQLKEGKKHGSLDFDLKRDSTIIFTSGSTGDPKPVFHKLENHYYSAIGSNENISFEKGDVWGIFLPLYHVGGMSIIFRAIISGAAVAITEKKIPILDAIRNLKITHISLVPTQLYRMLKEKDSIDTLRRLKAVLIGGSPIREAIIRKAKEMELPIFTTYGSTEMASQVTTTRPNDTLEHLLTSGRLLPHRELKIEDEEILVKGKTLFKGYLYKDGLIKPFSEDGWFRTGDIGYLTEDGYLVVKGRKDNMFISGGENIHPEEIENKLIQIEGILDAVVVPVEEEEWGKRPIAFVYWEGKGEIDEKRIKKMLEKELPKYKIPDRIFPIPENYKGMKLSREYFKGLAKRIVEGDKR